MWGKSISTDIYTRRGFLKAIGLGAAADFALDFLKNRAKDKPFCLLYHHKAPPEWELFDLKKDPMEMNNVYDDPAYAEVVKELKAELIRLRRQVGDNDGIVIS